MTQAMEGFYSPVDAAMLIKNVVREKFGFTVNVGISSNKLLAKMASDFEKPDKVHTLFPEEIRVKMWPLPIGELYMAGHSSVEILKKLNFQGEILEVTGEEDGAAETTVLLRQIWNGSPLFDRQVTLTYRGGDLVSMSGGRRLMGTPQPDLPRSSVFTTD